MRDQTSTAPPLAWSRAFPAAPEQVREARRFLAGVLDGGPAAGDAVLCLSELVTNATVHSRSGEPGGRFTVTAAIAGGRLRVEVRDEGGPWTQPVRSRDGQHGRGLLVVGQLARDWGRAGDSATGWTIWFTMNLGTPPATARPRHPAGEMTMTEPGPAAPAQYDPQRLRAMAADLAAHGLTTHLTDSRAGLDLTATLSPSGKREAELIIDEDGYAELRYWIPPGTPPAEVTAAALRALNAVTGAAPTRG
jgi:anti-sigma regulatory factor (Ser/Thr protein kinase)